MSGVDYTINYDLEKLMTDLLTLMDDEKSFKKAVKDGYAMTLVVSDYYHVSTWKLSNFYSSLTDDEIIKKLDKEITQAKSKMFKDEEIKIKIYHDEEKVYMEVQNTGKPLSEEGKERIRALLNDEDYQIKQAPGKHTSIGIRNVNRRIHLVYGEEYGLTITQDDNLLTTSRITIPYVNSVEDKSIKERTEVEQELKEVSKQKRKGKAEQ